MRRRWKALVAVVAVALLAGLIFLLPPRDDGLNWLRNAGGKGSLESQKPLDPVLVFRFEQMPPELVAECDRRSKSSEAWTFIADEELRTITVVKNIQRRRWIEQEIYNLKSFLGIEPR